MQKNKPEFKKIWIPDKNIKGEYEINIKGQVRNVKSKKILGVKPNGSYSITKRINKEKTYIQLGTVQSLRWDYFKGEITSELYLRSWKRISNMYKEVGSQFFVNKYGNVYDARLDKFHNTSLSNGYEITSVNGITVKIHRLVGMFIENNTGLDYDDLTIDHLNGIRNDNRPENLEWVSLSENTSRSHKNRNYKKDKSGKFIS
jgi:hypothetical protein